LISAAGNITSNSFVLGNAFYMTGINAAVSVSQIQNGTSNVKIGTLDGNVTIGVGGTGNVIVIDSGTLYTAGLSAVSLAHSGTNAVGNIGSTAQYFNQTFTDRVNATTLSASGNVTGGNVLTGGLISVTGTVTAGNITVATGNISGGNIVNNNANGVGNIGNATVYFNTVFGKATTAQYADLAELYSADAQYTPGTVLDFGGTNEVTISSVASSARVAGVVSTNPAHLMNSVLESEHKVALALQGRVPTSVTGTIRKGDMMVTAGNGSAQASAAPAMGTVIGKALENFDGVSGTIEIVVGRL
jgi:hypothetical protein